MTDDKKKNKQGMASADEDTRKRVSSAGGKAAQASGKGYNWNSERAKAAADKRWEEKRKRQQALKDRFRQEHPQ